MTRDEAMQKAIKLLRLAQSDNAHEAALAASTAQAILDKYELTAGMLDQNNNEPDEEIQDFGDRGAPLETCGKQLAAWKSYLSFVIAKVNGCRTYSRGEWSVAQGRAVTHLHVVGRASDAEKVRYVYSFLAKEVERLCLREGRGCGKTWRNQFRLGVVDTIREKLYEGQRETVQAMKKEYGGNSLALVKLDQVVAKFEAKGTDVDKWMDKNMKMGKKQSHPVYSDPGARSAGRKAGKEIQVSGARGSLPSAKTMIGGRR